MDTIYEKLRRGETVHVATSEGNKFSISQEPNDWRLPAYTITQDGIVQRKGMMLDIQTLRDWCAQLVEIEPE